MSEVFREFVSMPPVPPLSTVVCLKHFDVNVKLIEPQVSPGFKIEKVVVASDEARTYKTAKEWQGQIALKGEQVAVHVSRIKDFVLDGFEPDEPLPFRGGWYVEEERAAVEQLPKVNGHALPNALPNAMPPEAQTHPAVPSAMHSYVTDTSMGGASNVQHMSLPQGPHLPPQQIFTPGQNEVCVVMGRAACRDLLAHVRGAILHPAYYPPIEGALKRALGDL